MKILIVPYRRRNKLERNLEIRLDDDIYEKLKNVSINVSCQLRDGKQNYYFTLRVDGKRQALHRYIMGADRAHVVDHINRDTLDCVRSNMRLATVQQNCFNRSTASNSTKAGARAIYKNATGYSVRLSSFGVLYHVKYFDSESAAIQSRDELAKALFGEFSPYV